MEVCIQDDQLANAVLVVENEKLEWEDDSIAILGIPEKEPLEDLTKEAARLVIGQESRERNSTEALFLNPKILETIITKVLYHYHPNKPIHFRRTVQQLRLVCKQFLQAVTQTLRKKKQILFYLTLDKTNSLDNSPLVIEEFGKCLNNFVNWTYPDSSDSPSWYKEHRPLFSLKIMEEFFQQENHDSLLNCLLKCGNDLQKLEMFLPRNVFKLMFPPYQLPALAELVIHLVRFTDSIVKYSYEEFSEEEDTSTICLINSLLTASIQLKRLKLDNIKAERFCGVSDEPDLDIILPESLEKLELDLKMYLWQLFKFLEKPLPNLISLRFALPERIVRKVSEILKWNKDTLQELQIVCYEHLIFEDRLMPYPEFRFPLMEKLKSLQFNGPSCKLENNAVFLSSYLPSLEKIYLVQQECEFHKWINFSIYDNVHTVVLQLVREDNYPTKTLPISVKNMQLLHSAFPNVKRLTLKTTDEEKEGLQFLFREMTQLKYLKLHVVVTSIKNTNYWDGLFIGFVEEHLKIIMESPDKTIMEKSGLASICMLKELQELYLVATTVSGSDSTKQQGSLISDLAFEHAFLKMPNLRKLALKGQFWASDKMREEWKKQGRFLF